MNVLGFSGLHHSVRFKMRELPGLSPRQYRIAQGFDSAAALVTSTGIEAAAAEERFTREKATGTFPCNAIRYCLAAAGIPVDRIDYVAHGFCYEPHAAHFEQSDFARRQFAEVYARQAQLGCLERHFPGPDWEARLVRVPHHLAHASSAFYPSGFPEALILVSDGIGEVESTTVAIGRGHGIEKIAEVAGLHSLGILYGVFTLYLGFYMALDEYKVMGLAPYGDSRRYFARLMELINLKPDGGYTIPILYRNYALEQRETYSGTLGAIAEMFGPPREPESALTRHHMDIAAALQAVLETCLLHLLRTFRSSTAQRALCMAGGVALNCTANGLISRSGLFERIFVQPAAGDDGTALGAALYVRNLHQREPRIPRMTMPLWGPEYEDGTIADYLAGRVDVEATSFSDLNRLIQIVVHRLSHGDVVGWFQGRMEFGPRALGARSILADPRDPEMRDRLNRRVKRREDFRPFAPAVTAEAAARIFEIEPGEEVGYAHMVLSTRVRAEYRERLPATTHVDGSARVQTVRREDHPRFWALLDEFGRVAGLPVLLNTSFNVRGQPIVRTPDQAIDTFLAASLDAVVIGNFLVVPKDRLPSSPEPPPQLPGS